MYVYPKAIVITNYCVVMFNDAFMKNQSISFLHGLSISYCIKLIIN